MKRLSKIDFSEARPEVVRSKRTFGMFYGIIAGITFACASWGWDGYLLSKSHGYLPWLNLAAGMILCSIIGGLMGWLTARLEKSLLGVFFWFISSLFFAWLAIALPLQVAPYIVSTLNPQLGALLNYGSNIEFIFRFGVALAWIAPFALIVGVLQLPTIEPAVFSTSIFGKLIPFFICIVIMGISGIVSDSLINEQFRSAITGVDKAIQFVVDNKNNSNIDAALSRQVHARAFSTVGEYVKESRHLFVGSYDEYLGEIHVMVNFDGPWIDCNVLYGQPSTCKIAAGN
jgi:hypothetical protein